MEPTCDAKGAFGHCRLRMLVRFKKGETILAINESTGRTGVLESGEAHISSFDSEGRENILEVLSVGDSFSEFYMVPLDDQEYYVVADTDCSVLFINLKKALDTCPNDCENHNELLRTVILLSARHAQDQAVHIDVLSKRSLREKIMAYLEYQQIYYPKGQEMKLPMTLMSLANYLAVDRSAMMREIRRMNEDGLIQSSGRNFMILQKERSNG